MRFKLDPDYLAAAIVLVVLGGVFASGALWMLSEEFGFWRHPHFDGSPISHVKALLGLAGILVVGVGWIIHSRRQNDDGG